MVKVAKTAAKIKGAAKHLKYGGVPTLFSWTAGSTWLSLILQSIPFLLLPFAGNLIGYLYTGLSPARYSRAEWQRRLKRPSFTPPDWVFGPVWTFLYLAMGLASFIVWRTAGGFNMHSQWPLILYGLSLALNWAWPLLFFVQGKLLHSALCLTALWAVVALAIPAFWHVHPLAGKLLIPYLAWLTLAGIINWFIVKDNAEPKLPPFQKYGAGGADQAGSNVPFGRQRAGRVSGGAANEKVIGGGDVDGNNISSYKTPSAKTVTAGTTGAYQRAPVPVNGAAGSGGSDNDLGRED